MVSTNGKLLRVENLVMYFATLRGPVQAVDGVDFELGDRKSVV